MEEAKRVIIVSSTTGDGEQPENVIKFWRKLRPKSLSPHHLGHWRFALLGLGDTNYNQFCNAPKALLRRLTELGAAAFYPAAWADDGTGLEVVVEPWLEGLWDAVDKLDTMESGSQGDGDVEIIVQKLPEIHIDQKLSSYTLPACPKPFLNIDYKNIDLECAEESTFEGLPSQAGASVKGTVIRNDLLSDHSVGKEVKEYRELVVTCEGLQYTAGDTVGVLVTNPPQEVAALRARLGLTSEQWRQACAVTLRTDAAAKPKAKVPPHLASAATSLQQLFTSAVDIRAVPKKLLVRGLLECAEDNKDRELLSLLCSKEGAKEFAEQVTESRTGLLELLGRVPSCRPAPALLLEHLPRLLPRPYSLSSSGAGAGAGAGQLAWVFTRVTEPRPGLATTWLAQLAPGHAVTFYPRSSSSFHPPADPGQDFIMVAAGSGVGPFIGFLKDRKNRMDRGEKFSGKCWLFYGCRYSDADNICRHLVEEMLQAGALDNFTPRFSREAGAGRGYVQHGIEAEGAAVARWLEEGAALYVCGDGRGMAAGVKQAVTAVLGARLGEQEGQDFVKKMVTEKKYKEDIWS